MKSKYGLKILFLIFTILFTLAIPVFAAPKAKSKPAAKKPVVNVKPAPATAAPAAPQNSGLEYAADIISVKGSGLRVKRITSPHYMIGRVNMPNYVKDLIETDKETVSCIEFLNGSQIGINKNTQIEIVSTTEAKDITQRGFVDKMVLKSGTVWAKITGQKSRDFKVVTSKGVMGIKGTEFVVETHPETGTEKITLLEGEVEFTNASGKVEKINPGDVLDLSGAGDPEISHIDDVSQVRNALNGQFPGLNPAEQAIVSVFFSHAIGMIPGASGALGVANDALSFVDNPEQYIANRVSSEITGRVGLPIGISFGGGGGKKQPEPKDIDINGLKPNGSEIENYYPEFAWEPVKGADAYRVFVTVKPFVKGEKEPGFYAFATVKENKFKYTSNARALKPNATYYWTVVAINKDKKSIAISHEPGFFRMAGYEKLGIRGLSPSGEIDPFTGELVLDWTPVRGVKKYKVEVSSKPTMEEPVITKETDTNFLSVADASLVLFKDREYFWKVTPLEKEADTPEISGAVNSFKILPAKKPE